jgi:hypothetical protein
MTASVGSVGEVFEGASTGSPEATEPPAAVGPDGPRGILEINMRSMSQEAAKKPILLAPA